MRSQIFAAVEVDEHFRSQCERLCKVNDLVSLFALFERLQKTGEAEERRQLCEASAPSLGVKPPDLFAAWFLLRYIAIQLLKPVNASDTPEDLAVDLSVCASGCESRLDDLVQLMTALKSYSNRERSNIRAKEFGRFVVPRVNSFNGVVDARAVFDRESIPKEAGYEPEFLGIVTSVLLQFETTSNSNDEIIIQLSEEQLDNLIDNLSSLKKELVVAKTALKLKS